MFLSLDGLIFLKRTLENKSQKTSQIILIFKILGFLANGKEDEVEVKNHGFFC